MSIIFDVILVVAGKDLDNLGLVCNNLIKHFSPEKIVVITNDTIKAESKVISNNILNVQVMDEREILKPLDKLDISSLKVAGFPSRYFWYYQQFLKILYAHHCKSKYYLIWDADTIPIKKMSFFNDENRVNITCGNEKLHQEYVDTNKLLFDSIDVANKSFISQHMMIDRNVMLSLISEVETKFLTNFQTAVLANLQGESLSQFSEYELYANYYTSIKSDYVIINRSWFRYGASLCGFTPNESNLRRLSRYYEYVAFEKFDVGIFKRVRAYIQYYFDRLF
jgi:hypothetical protein